MKSWQSSSRMTTQQVVQVRFSPTLYACSLCPGQRNHVSHPPVYVHFSTVQVPQPSFLPDLCFFSRPSSTVGIAHGSQASSSLRMQNLSDGPDVSFTANFGHFDVKRRDSFAPFISQSDAALGAHPMHVVS